MEIVNGNSDNIVFGEVLKWKTGSGMDEKKLTIVTLSNMRTKDNIKVLCWNFEEGPQLSDRAKCLHMGDLISIRAIFDRGDSHKCVAQELKSSGTYRLKNKFSNNIKLLYGKISDIIKMEDGVRALIPVYQFNGEKMDTYWYCAEFIHQYYTEDVRTHIRRGAACFVSYDYLKHCEAGASNIIMLHATHLTIMA